MPTNDQLFRFIAALAPVLLVACTSPQVPTPSGSLDPIELTEENFYEAVGAELVPASVAASLVSLAECADTGTLRLEGPAAGSAQEALDALIREFRVALARSGSNAYVMQETRWVTLPEAPGTTALHLQARGLICSA